MNDKERILMNIIQQLNHTFSLAPNPKGYTREDFKRHGQDGVYAHFAQYREPKIGDLVLCQTMNINDWKIGIYEQQLSNDEAIIREIGSDRKCRIYNERFIPIDGVWPELLLEGDEYLFYIKVQKAFARGYEYLYRFGGVDFDGRDATIWVRKAFSGKRFPVHIHWNKKTSIKKILETMREQGYGTKEFENND